MNNKKKAILLASTMSLLLMSGCKKNDSENEQNIDNNIVQNYVTNEKEFAPGEHFVTSIYQNNSILIASNKNFALESFENLYVPEGYSVQDYEYITAKGSVDGLSVLFVNNKTVNAIGVLKEDGNYHYDDFGEIIKEKTLEK